MRVEETSNISSPVICYCRYCVV